MASPTKKSKISGNEDNTCKWCEKEFKSTSTLAIHVCVKKRRWADKDEQHIRLAFRVFQKFYTMTTTQTVPKTEEEFIRSQYYEGFVRFGRSCVSNEYVDPERFAEWLIRHSKKLDDWAKDKLYDEFLMEYIKREPATKALERTIRYIDTWAEEHNHTLQDYFSKVSTNRAVYDLRSAKVSPWVVYLSLSGGQLLERFSSEQVDMIASIIDASFWARIFDANSDDVDMICTVCEEAGL